MKKLFGKIPPYAEFAIVVTAVFGYYIYSSISLAWQPGSTPPATLSERHELLVHQLIMLAVVGTFLCLRGWDFKKIGLKPTVKDTFIGLGLWFYVLCGWIVVWKSFKLVTVLTGGVDDSDSGKYHPAPELDLAAIFGSCVVSPLTEEIFTTGYVITFLKTVQKPWVAVTVSLSLRVLTHVYQGPWGACMVGVTGIVLAAWFVKKGRLWPAIMVHVFINSYVTVMYMLKAGE